jgi:hypothetical protein
MPYQQFREMSVTDRRALVILGAGIRIGRRRLGLTQRELAERSGVSQTAISRLERGMVWGMAVVRFARVAWALEERTPFGGCPHPHQCDYGARWEQVMADHVGAIDSLRRQEALRALGADWSPGADWTMIPADPPEPGHDHDHDAGGRRSHRDG